VGTEKDDFYKKGHHVSSAFLAEKLSQQCRNSKNSKQIAASLLHLMTK